MKTKTINPKSQFLLGAGLDVLHFESKEWMETLAFWQDEVKFFNHLLNRQDSLDKDKRTYGEMLKKLDKIHNDFFEDIEDNVVEHEKYLSRLVKGERGISDSEYLEKHRQLKDRIETFSKDFKEFKQIVFGYMKELE